LRKKNPRVLLAIKKVELIPPNKIQFIRLPAHRFRFHGKGYAVRSAVRSSPRPRHQKRPGPTQAAAVFTPSAHLQDNPPGSSTSAILHKIDPYVLLTENSVSTSEQTPLACSPTNPQVTFIDPQKASRSKTNLAVGIVAKINDRQ